MEQKFQKLDLMDLLTIGNSVSWENEYEQPGPVTLNDGTD